jgi:nicotinate-nucleotide--dimethylbenzimidazole phosphoribosyltransferase
VNPLTDQLDEGGDVMEFGEVAAPDGRAAAAARRWQDTLTKPGGSLGRLEDLSVWVSACQGNCPPTQFVQARIVVFAGDHGVARHGVSAYPTEVTAQMVDNIEADTQNIQTRLPAALVSGRMSSQVGGVHTSAGLSGAGTEADPWVPT